MTTAPAKPPRKKKGHYALDSGEYLDLTRWSAAKLQEWLDNGGDANAHYRRKPLLCLVIQAGRPDSDLRKQRDEKVRILLDAGANPTTPMCKQGLGKTALHIALCQGDSGLMELLLERCMNVDPRDKSMQTPLHWAAAAGYEWAVGELVAAGADLNARDCEGKVPLRLAYANRVRCPNLIPALLKAGADPMVPDNAGITPTWFYCQKRMPLATVIALVDHDGNLDTPGPDGRSARDLLRSNWQLDMLVSAGLEDAALDAQANPPKFVLDKQLIAAAGRGDAPKIAALLGKGAAVNAVATVDGQTALHRAALNGYTDAAGELLSAGADLNAVATVSGDTPLHNACSERQLKMIAYLLARGCDANGRNKLGDTPLHALCHKCERGRKQDVINAIRILIDGGADPVAKNEAGQTPSDIVHRRIWNQDIKHELLSLFILASPGENLYQAPEESAAMGL